jgi:WD40 repeat protein
LYFHADYALLTTGNGHEGGVLSVAFDTYLLASGFSDKTIKIWDKNTGDLLRTLTGHSERVNSVAFDSIYLLASGSRDKTVKLLNKHNGDLVRTLIYHGDIFQSVAFSSDNILADGFEDKTIRL